jgi:DNA polymerase (family 10)
VKSKKEVIALLEQIAVCLQAKQENIFKIQAFQKAAKSVKGILDWQTAVKNADFGLGKKTSEVVQEYLEHDQSFFLEELKKEIPEGLLELIQLQGVGVKTALKLIEDYQVHSVEQLKKVLSEKKPSSEILKAIANFEGYQHQFRLDQALIFAEQLKQDFQKQFLLSVHFAGELRRKCPIIRKLVLLCSEVNPAEQKAISDWVQAYCHKAGCSVPIEMIFGEKQEEQRTSFLLTGSELFLEGIQKRLPLGFLEQKGLFEKDIFAAAGLPYIPAVYRETPEVFSVELAHAVRLNSIKGVFHVHSVYSDGANTLEQMVQGAIDRGYEYVGISDHSQSAFYAHGLKWEDIQKQKKEVQLLRKKYPQIVIFFGVESDILKDGSLDYDDGVLAEFDFVIASIHSRFEMSEQAMTQRMLRALENPFTRFLGHATGRLLLEREPYPVDLNALIAFAAKKQIAVELNSSCSRLDFDWTYGKVMREQGCLSRINPDAHCVADFDQLCLGVWMAQKALMPADQFVNTHSVEWVRSWLKIR